MGYTNFVSDPARAEALSVASALASLASTVTDENALSKANTISAYYSQLQDMRVMQFSTLTSGNEAVIDSLIEQVKAVLAAKNTYQSAPTAGNLSALKSALTAINVVNFTVMVNSLSKLWSTQEKVYYEYSRAGEAELNTQLGLLGDALDALSQVIDIVNQVEVVLSINPTNGTVSQVKYDGTLTTDYYEKAPASFILSDPNGGSTPINAAVYAYNAYTNLNALKSNFANNPTIYNAIQTVLSDLGTAGVPGWGSVTDPVENSPSTFWACDFKLFWENTTWRQNVNNLQTTLSSQNDVQKQNLRQAMFIYTEFIKSASLVMDRVYDAMKAIAGRISR